MAIVFDKENRLFTLCTKNSMYQMKADDKGILLHTYYGRKTDICDYSYLIQRRDHGFSGNPDEAAGDRTYSTDTLPQEYTAYGNGDYRINGLEVEQADGSDTANLKFESYEITKGKYSLKGLPAMFAKEDEAETLEIVLADRVSGLKAHLLYSVFPHLDVITRAVRLEQTGETPVTVKKAMSMEMDFEYREMDAVHFYGRHNVERQMERTHLGHANWSVGSIRGTSSHHHNPFVILCDRNTEETYGNCYGYALAYSGNFTFETEVDQVGHTRVVMGIHPYHFAWTLEKGDTFETPEVIMSYSAEGFGKLSRIYHDAYRNNLIRSKYVEQPRPILVNNWEATYFDFDADKLYHIAEEARNIGLDMFVLDDGWFGKRDNDWCALGDWEVNEEKIKGGLPALAERIHGLGLKFGLWVEPEMISENSRLYQEHPDWAMMIPGHPHSEGRNQRLLDLCNPEVQQYVIDSMTKVFSSGEIRYVKWDMNRNFSDIYSPYLPAAKQGETAHRYVLGLYHIMDELTTRFPEILFEGCSSGGNRFDLGILSYFPQIWASDNTDALCRTGIQNSYSYGYPLSVFTAHVSSCPNHQTLRITPLETRFQVASFGILGYECNLKDLSGSDLNAIREQIALYKKWRDVFQFGTFYRGTENEDSDSETLSWTCVSPDGRRAVGLFFRRLTTPNQSHDWYRPVGLLPDVKYHFYGRNIKYNLKDFGDLVNTVSPVHIKQGSALQEILSRFVNMDGEKEDLTAYGDTLMLAGIALKPAFAGTGYNSDTRLFPDFSSRMYFMEAVE